MNSRFSTAALLERKENRLDHPVQVDPTNTRSTELSEARQQLQAALDGLFGDCRQGAADLGVQFQHYQTCARAFQSYQDALERYHAEERSRAAARTVIRRISGTVQAIKGSGYDPKRPTVKIPHAGVK